MDNNENALWMLIILGGYLLAAISFATTLIAIVCSVSCIRKRFPFQPVVVYWMFTGVVCALVPYVDMHIAVWYYILPSPVFALLFWYYDHINSKRKHSPQLSEHAEIS
jgi:hypothetical protein